MEEWKFIVGFEKYMVSNLGRVKSLNYKRTGKEQLLLPNKNNRGYLWVTLYKNGADKKCLIHRLVAEAFIPNPDNLSQVNHINENKTDNRVDNLEWCSAIYNMNYGERTKKQSETRKKLRMLPPRQDKAVEMFTLEGDKVAEFVSIADAARQNNFTESSVGACVRGYSKTCHGVVFRYKNNY